MPPASAEAPEKEEAAAETLPLDVLSDIVPKELDPTIPPACDDLMEPAAEVEEETPALDVQPDTVPFEFTPTIPPA